MLYIRGQRRSPLKRSSNGAPSRGGKGEAVYMMDNGKKRVVITGMGVVSPNGVGNAAFSDAVLAGRSGVKRISRFDPSEIPVQIAGEVRDFDELAWDEKRDRKHVSRVLPLAIAAGTEALSDA